MTIERELMERIQTIPDPCSLATGVPLSIGEMGLLQALECNEGRVTVRLQLTSPMCMMAAYFMREIDQRLRSHEGVQSVHVEFDHALEWRPEHISSEGRQRLAERRITMIGGRMLPSARPGT
ncbi:iron-sulfur cluster assembly protein [Archangium violaceum]|uniref:metal-sulfur cluster assembly factor n=1 Tax=Archangium violaceum TaxID=83451 RepID=UPI002B28D734|nr:iron-sulfur cluster assembly protein [Archangium gephyra]